MTSFRAAILAAPFVFAGAAATAQDVTLMSRDGSVAISGTLLSYDGEYYRVDSDFGVLTLDGSGVICDGPGCPDLTAFVADVTFSGAQSMGTVLMPALVEAFAIRNGFALERVEDGAGRFTYVFTDRSTGARAARFHFRLSDPDEGFADLLAEDADVVLSTREVTTQEISLVSDAGMGDLSTARHARIVGVDALVPLVPVSNRISGIAMADLGRVFAGEITSWAAFGGPDEPITLHLPDTAQGADGRLAAVALEPQGLALAEGIVRHDSASELAEAVAADPFAIGLGLFSERGNAETLPLTGPCGARSVASPRSLKTEDYPLTAPLFIYTPARRLPRIGREFLAYLTSPAAQPVVRRAGFIDQFPESVPIEVQGLRLATAITSAGEETSLADLQRMVDRLAGLDRLTVTFRFENGSSEMDAQSRSNVELLAEALERGVFDDRRLLFAGFSDGQGPAGTNRDLALERAQAVRSAVAAAARTLDTVRVQMDAEAFGEAMPMACDDTAWGRRINRRVEVWVE